MDYIHQSQLNLHLQTLQNKRKEMRFMVLDSAKAEKREANPEAAKQKEYEQYDLNKDIGDGDTWTG